MIYVHFYILRTRNSITIIDATYVRYLMQFVQVAIIM